MERFLRTQKTNYKRKTDKLDFTKIKNISLKDTVKKVKIQATPWEKMFMKYICEKGFIS